MRLDLLFFGDQVEQDLCGRLAFLAGGLLHHGDRGAGNADPLGVIEAEEPHAVGHERVEIAACLINLGQGPAVGGKHKRWCLPIDVCLQKALELFLVDLVVFEYELRKAKVVGLEGVDKAAKALDTARDKAGRCRYHQKALVTLFDAGLDRLIGGLVIVGFDPVGAKVVEL